MKRKKILLRLLIICCLVIGSSNFAFAEEGLTWNLTTTPRNYSNSKSSGTICYMANTNTVVYKIFYNDDYEIIFSKDNDGIELSMVLDKFGTAYMYKLIQENGDSKLYQTFYYNRDIANDMQPLIINGEKVYTNNLYSAKVDYLSEDKDVTLVDLVDVEGNAIEDVSNPSYELIKTGYEKEKQDNPQITESPSNTETAYPQSSENPSKTTEIPTNTSASNPSETSTSNPKKTTSPNPKNTVTPSATNSPSSGNSSSSDGMNKIVVKKVKNTTKLLQNGKIVERFVFNKKTGNVKFYGRKKVKKVKYVFFIKKSYNYGFITKKGKFYIIKRDSHKIKRYSGKWKKAVIKKNLGIKIKNSKKTKKIIGL
ncbi:MAG: hypothetical protein K6F77_03145 [Lachnospiraceae bacterium]|nr:hypothetical protein [Lachnospiraceae bacterium]